MQNIKNRVFRKSSDCCRSAKTRKCLSESIKPDTQLTLKLDTFLPTSPIKYKRYLNHHCCSCIDCEIAAELKRFTPNRKHKNRISPYLIDEQPLQRAKASFSPTLDALCSEFNKVSISPRPKPRNFHRQLPDHDRKILQRMAIKRNEEKIRQSNAYIAHRYWDIERTDREQLLLANNAEIEESVRQSRTVDRQALAQRRKVLSERDAFQIKQKQQRIYEKGRTSAQSIEWARVARRIEIATYQQLERERCSRAEERRFDVELDGVLRVEQCWNRQACRLKRAQRLRDRLTEEYRQRLLADNEKQLVVHAAKLAEAKAIEQDQRERWTEEIRVKTQRSEMFVHDRDLAVLRAKEQARWTAELRDDLRHASSPDPESYRMCFE